MPVEDASSNDAAVIDDDLVEALGFEPTALRNDIVVIDDDDVDATDGDVVDESDGDGSDQSASELGDPPGADDDDALAQAMTHAFGNGSTDVAPVIDAAGANGSAGAVDTDDDRDETVSLFAVAEASGRDGEIDAVTEHVDPGYLSTDIEEAPDGADRPPTDGDTETIDAELSESSVIDDADVIGADADFEAFDVDDVPVAQEEGIAVETDVADSFDADSFTAELMGDMPPPPTGPPIVADDTIDLTRDAEVGLEASMDTTTVPETDLDSPSWLGTPATIDLDAPPIEEDVAAAAPATVVVPASTSRLGRTRGKRQIRARKARRVLRHIDPWSVLTFSVLFHLVFFAALLLASVLVWNAAVAAGTIESIEDFIITLGDYETFEINGDAVFRAAVIIAGMLTLASSVLVVLLTVIFNLISDLIGGIRVTVIEEEVVRVATTENGSSKK